MIKRTSAGKTHPVVQTPTENPRKKTPAISSLMAIFPFWSPIELHHAPDTKQRDDAADALSRAPTAPLLHFCRGGREGGADDQPDHQPRSDKRRLARVDRGCSHGPGVKALAQERRKGGIAPALSVPRHHGCSMRRARSRWCDPRPTIATIL